MSTVQNLMLDMNHRTLTKEEFQLLTNMLINSNGELCENWLTIIDQFTMNGRSLLAKQGNLLFIMILIISMI